MQILKEKIMRAIQFMLIILFLSNCASENKDQDQINRNDSDDLIDLPLLGKVKPRNI